MATKKYYMVSKYETKEDYDKHFKDIYYSGYGSGYKDGMTEALSYVFECIDHFSHETQRDAEWLNGQRHKENWKAQYEANKNDPANREQRAQMKQMLEMKKFMKETIKSITNESDEKE